MLRFLDEDRVRACLQEGFLRRKCDYDFSMTKSHYDYLIRTSKLTSVNCDRGAAC